MRLRFEHGRRDDLETLHPAYFALVMATTLVGSTAEWPLSAATRQAARHGAR
ncbi:MAG: hypothetical protein WAV38_14610 [Xanthobacteraceae bacterium]